MKLAAVIAVVALMAVMFLSPKKKSAPLRPAETASVMEDISVVHVDLGRTEWTANIQKAVINSATNAADISGITFVFPKHSLSVSADSGTYSFLSDDLQLRGSVHAHREDIDIYLDSMQWLSGERKLTSDSEALVQGKEFTVNGKGLTVLSDGIVRIERDVRARILPERIPGGR